MLDVDDNPVVTLGNQGIALIFMKAFGMTKGGCLEPPHDAQEVHECYGYEGYPAQASAGEFDPDGVVQFEMLAPLISTGNLTDVPFSDRAMFLRFYARGWKERREANQILLW